MKKTVTILTVLLVIAGAIVIGILANRKPVVLSREYTFPGATWNKTNLVYLSYEVPEKFVGKTFSMYMEMTYSPSIRRNSIRMDITAFSPEGDERTAEYTLFLKDAEGKFKGEVSGNSISMKQLMRNNYVFSQPGIWKFELDQRSELYDFAGLETMRLIFEETPEGKNKNE